MNGEGIARFIAALDASLREGTFVKLTLGKYRGSEAGLANIYVRPVTIKSAAQLSFLTRHKTKDVVKNFGVDEGLRRVEALLGASFLSGHLFTTRQDTRIEFNRRREARMTTGPPTFREAAREEHDRVKRRLIETEGNAWLRALGVTNGEGAVREKMGDKFRQINKFVEIVAGLFDSSRLKERKEFTIVDMGSGKGYLTFALYDYFSRARNLKPDVKGIEARPELAEKSNEVARLCGFDGLRFQAGHIHDVALTEVDLLIALHACDTATDDALFKGIAARAEIIITAPCCHKEVRPQIKAPDALRGALRHGILLEREAETVTDSLRALLLERAGYAVKVFEFISNEHTRKNTMIACVRREGSAGREAAMREFKALKEFYGIREQRLETLLRESGQV
jgi:hypothetical protein